MLPNNKSEISKTIKYSTGFLPATQANVILMLFAFHFFAYSFVAKNMGFFMLYSSYSLTGMAFLLALKFLKFDLNLNPVKILKNLVLANIASIFLFYTVYLILLQKKIGRSFTVTETINSMGLEPLAISLIFFAFSIAAIQRKKDFSNFGVTNSIEAEKNIEVIKKLDRVSMYAFFSIPVGLFCILIFLRPEQEFTSEFNKILKPFMTFTFIMVTLASYKLILPKIYNSFTDPDLQTLIKIRILGCSLVCGLSISILSYVFIVNINNSFDKSTPQNGVGYVNFEKNLIGFRGPYYEIIDSKSNEVLPFMHYPKEEHNDIQAVEYHYTYKKGYLSATIYSDILHNNQ